MRTTYETNVFGVVAVTNAFLRLLRRSSAGRIVNVSSVMASLAVWSDPDSPIAQNAPVALAYNSSKTALNALTLAYARALDGSVTVDAADPGFVATDLNGHTGSGAAIVVRLAMMDGGRTTGGFFSDAGPVAW